MDLRELLVILIVTALGGVFVWYETGRSRAILATLALMLGGFAVVGTAAVIAL
jgi:hypothetical protein